VAVSVRKSRFVHKTAEALLLQLSFLNIFRMKAGKAPAVHKCDEALLVTLSIRPMVTFARWRKVGDPDRCW